MKAVDNWSEISPHVFGIVIKRSWAFLRVSDWKCLSNPQFFIPTSGQFVYQFEMNALSAFLLEIRSIRVALMHVEQKAAPFPES